MKTIKNFLRNNFIFYYYDNKELSYKIIKIKYLILIIVVMFFTLELFRNTIVKHHCNSEKIIVVDETSNKFSEEELIQLIKDLNMKFPHIVLAQAKLETGNFDSNIFKENNNLFGMKQARIRTNIARGTKNNHAYYHNWQESVYDYAFYQSTYLSKIKTDEEYFKYLNDSYAQSTNYITTLKGMIDRGNLDKIFYD